MSYRPTTAGRAGHLVAAVALVIAIGAPLSARAGTEPAPAPVPVSVVIPEQSTTASPAPSASPTPSSSAAPTSGTGSTGGPSGAATPAAPAGPPAAPTPAVGPTKSAPPLALDNDRVTPNSWMVVKSSGFAPGESVQVVLYSQAVVIGSFVADATGNLAARFRIPDGMRSGTHVVEATGWVSGHITNQSFTVENPSSVGGTSPLWSVAMLVGILLIAAVALLLFFRSSPMRASRRILNGGVAP